ncbi:hypothetical protein ACFLYG_02145 [Chloroflexota bacterium]
MWLFTGLAIVAVFALVLISPANERAVPSHSGVLKAAIIDQLYTLKPNEIFITQVSQQLQNCGFEVDIYQGEEVTVDLYRKLPSYDYKLIIFRAHSASLGWITSIGQKAAKTCLFSGEPYSQRKHVIEQLAERVVIAKLIVQDLYFFGVKSEFITETMEGKFPDTAIIMMGCSTLYIEDMAQAFVEKGASSYIGWDAEVSLDHMDEASTYLVKQLCQAGVTIEESVRSANKVLGPDPKYGATLKYFPSQSADKTLREPIESAADRRS